MLLVFRGIRLQAKLLLCGGEASGAHGSGFLSSHLCFVIFIMVLPADTV